MTGAAGNRSEPGTDAAAISSGTQRLDKWLWFARLIKTRSMATRLVAAGKVRVNRVKCDKPSQAIRADDVITAVIGPNVRVLRVLAPGKRRGPAPEAQALYEDLAPVERRSAKSKVPDLGIAIPGRREPGAGRPTKRDRRLLDRLRSGDA